MLLLGKLKESTVHYSLLEVGNQINQYFLWCDSWKLEKKDTKIEFPLCLTGFFENNHNIPTSFKAWCTANSLNFSDKLYQASRLTRFGWSSKH